jgi:nucleosome binding factor SPN SPT16 subunit
MEGWHMRPGRRYTGSVQLVDNTINFIAAKPSATTPGASIQLYEIESVFYYHNQAEKLYILHFHLQYSVQMGTSSTKDIQFCKKLAAKAKSESDTKEREFVDKIQTSMQALRGAPFEIHYPNDFQTFKGTCSGSLLTFMIIPDFVVSILDRPFFVIQISGLSVVVQERLLPYVKNCDLTLVSKPNPPLQSTFVTISYIDKEECQTLLQVFQ